MRYKYIQASSVYLGLAKSEGANDECGIMEVICGIHQVGNRLWLFECCS